MDSIVLEGITTQVLNEANYLERNTRVQSHPNIYEEKVILFDLYKKEPRKTRKRSLWDGCSLKLYSRQYYQGNEIRYDRSQRRVRNNHYPKSIKTFGKCCWRIFWHGRKTRAHFLQGNSEYPSENLFPVLKRVGSVVLNPKRGGICN